MKRIAMEVVLGLIVVGLGVYVFLLTQKLGNLESELAGLKDAGSQLEQLRLTNDENQILIENLQKKGMLVDAAQEALASGIVLKDIAAAAAAEAAEGDDDTGENTANNSGMNADRYLAIGAIRMLMFGQTDSKAVGSFQKALELVNLSSKLKSVCAAQAGIAASGKNIKILSECKQSASVAN